MNFKVSSSALYNRLSIASKVMGSKNSMPILDCFLFEIKGGNIVITASDSEKYLITSVPAIESTEDTRFCIQAKTIMDSIKELPEQPINFEFDINTLEIKGTHNSGTFHVMAQMADTYPQAKDISDEATEIQIPSEVILNGISRCLFATANDEIRVVMNGIYFDIKPDHIVFAGTDGRKLVRNRNYKVKSGLECGFILPKKVSTILKGILSKDDELVSIRFDKKKAVFKTEDITLHFSLIEGRYPNYNAVISENNPFAATIDRQALSSALKRISVFCNQSSGLVKLELSNNTLKLTGQDNEYATSAEEYLTCDYTNTPISIGFSCQFLLEITSILTDESITIELADPSRPGVLHPAQEDPEDALLMLLMPMRVED